MVGFGSAVRAAWQLQLAHVAVALQPAAKEQGRGHPVDLGCWHVAAHTRSIGGKIPPKHTVVQNLDERKMDNFS